MEMSEHMMTLIVYIIVILVCLIIFVFITEAIFGSDSVKKIVCGGLFWIPFGNIFTALTHGCGIIPA